MCPPWSELHIYLIQGRKAACQFGHKIERYGCFQHAAEVDDTNRMSPNFFINIQAIKDSSKNLFDKISENSPKFENLSKILKFVKN